MRRFLSIALLGAVGLLFPTKACADLTMVEGANFGPGVVNILGIKPFNPALGTLKSVGVTLAGTVTANINVLPCGSQGPCPYELSLDQNFFGLLPGFFSFGTDANFIFSGVDPTIVENYIYTFTFNASTDLLGFVVPDTLSSGSGTLVPPGFVDGKLSNFLPSIVAFNEIDESLKVGTLSGATLGSLSDQGGLIILYNYTPPLPEPSSLLLLASGLSALIFRGRIQLLPRSH